MMKLGFSGLEQTHFRPGAARAYFFTFLWLRDRSETLRNGPGMLLDRFSTQTVISGPESGHF